MATKTVTDQSFATDVLGAAEPVLVDFWAEWCGPCRMIAPALEEIAGELGDKVTVAKLNIDENPDIPGRYGVRGIPTMLLFKGGQPVAQKVGAAPRSQIQQWLESNLDPQTAVERRLSALSRAARFLRVRAYPAGTCRAAAVCRRGRTTDLACPEDVKSGRDRARIVERRDAEIDGFRLVVDLHQERRPAFAAEFAVAEARRSDRLHLVRAFGPDEVAVGNAGEDHRRRAAVELAGAAMAPAAVERLALQLVADCAAHASAGQSRITRLP